MDDSHRADVLALATLVYPHDFRPRTPVPGRYFGMYVDGCLVAMIGERMSPTRGRRWARSARILGRGHAQHLLRWLSSDIHARGWTPFLHVALTNTRTVGLYRRNGSRLRRGIGFSALTRRRWRGPHAQRARRTQSINIDTPQRVGAPGTTRSTGTPSALHAARAHAAARSRGVACNSRW